MSRQKPGQRPEIASRRGELEQLAHDRFAFLVQSKGFVQRPSKQTVFSNSDYYVQTSVQLGLEVQIDYRDETVRVALLRLRGGRLPEDGFVAGGERIRIDFLVLLRKRLHVDDEAGNLLVDLLYHQPKTGLFRSFAYADELFARWSDFVERHIDLVGGQPVDVLFPPPPPNASPADQSW